MNVNTDAVVSLTSRLENINRSAFPVAVRGALNDAAFDMKRKTLPESAARNFTRRSPNFFKTFSAVDKATGFRLNSFRAVAGMTDQNKPTARTAVAHMEQQEFGGSITDGADYLAGARGGNNKKKVTGANRFSQSKNLSGAYKRGGTKSSRYIAAAYASLKNNKRMSFVGKDGSRYLAQVTSIRKSKGGKVNIKSRLLIKDRSSKPVTIRATHFASEAAEKSSRKMEEFYIKQAEKQFERALRR